MKFRLQKDAARKAIGYINAGAAEPVVLVSGNPSESKVAFEGAKDGVYVCVFVDAEIDPLMDGERPMLAMNGPHLSALRFPTAVEFQTNHPQDGIVHFTSGTMKGRISMEANGNYILLQRPRVNAQMQWVEVDRELLKRATSAVVFKPAIERPTDGITIRLGDGRFMLHENDATGIRGALYVEQVPTLTMPEVSAVLSIRFFELLAKIPGTGAIRMAIDGGVVRVRSEEASISYPQIQIEPDDLHSMFTSLLARERAGVFRIHAKRWAEIVSAVSSVARGGVDYDHRMEFTCGTSSGSPALSLSMVTKDGAITDSALLDGEFEPCAFTISGKHLLEMLALTSGDLRVHVYDNSIIIEGAEGKSLVFLATYPR